VEFSSVCEGPSNCYVGRSGRGRKKFVGKHAYFRAPGPDPTTLKKISLGAAPTAGKRILFAMPGVSGAGWALNVRLCQQADV
jgi:hypothetical protein